MNRNDQQRKLEAYKRGSKIGNKNEIRQVEVEILPSKKPSLIERVVDAVVNTFVKSEIPAVPQEEIPTPVDEEIPEPKIFRETVISISSDTYKRGDLKGSLDSGIERGLNQFKRRY